MTKPAFTPGPWVAEPINFSPIDEWSVSADGFGEIVSVHGSDGCDDPAMFPGTANAHLIAAAPELFEACQASLVLGQRVYHNANAHEAPKDWAEVRALLQTAISKALGEQS